MCEDAQIPKRVRSFLRMVAETPALDDLCIFYDLIMCVDAQIPNRGAEFLCVWLQKLRHWMTCVSSMFYLASQVQIV